METLRRNQRLFLGIGLGLILLIALYLRMAGLFRGLGENYVYHPDEPKQIMALHHYLNGRYVWYVGNLFYDGYPFGLNHLDEWILRPVFGLGGLFRTFLGGAPVHSREDPYTLYYWVRGLRVLYGLLCLAFAWFVSRRFLESRRSAFLAVALFALAPVSVAVSHMGTGDVGTDLFSILTILFLCCYVRQERLFYLFGSAVMTGAAFACKYNGALAGLSLAFLLLFQVTSWVRFRQVVARGILALFGFLVGVLVLTPALLIRGKRTGVDIVANFSFIQNFGVTSQFRALPWTERIQLCLQGNVPRIVYAMGWAVMLLALVGLAASVVAFIRARKGASVEESCPSSLSTLRLSVILAAFVALGISLVGKPEIQPFHFSYLQFSFILGAVYGVEKAWTWGHPYGRRLAVVLSLVLIAEFSIRMERETFFWKRDDNLLLTQGFARETLAVNEGPAGVVKTVILEPENPSVFRNRKRDIRAYRAGFWNNIHIAPVPSVPYPEDLDWIFLNGPVYPRNDRMFRAKGNQSTEKHLVLYHPPGPVKIGLRSGSVPSRVRLSVGEAVTEEVLQPNEQRIVELSPRQWRRVRRRGGLLKHDVFFVPVRVDPAIGDVWVTVLQEEREIACFRIFGGDSGAGPFSLPADISPEEIVEQTAVARFLESELDYSLVLDAGDPDTDTGGLPLQPTALAAGAYILECEVIALTPVAAITLQLTDPLNLSGGEDVPDLFAVDRNPRTLRFAFTKAFAPLECHVSVKCLEGRVRIQAWKIIPNTARILADLQVWADGNPVPSWLSRFSPEAGNRDLAGRNKKVLFGEKMACNRFLFPEALPRDGSMEVFADFSVAEFPVRNFKEYSVFLHILDSSGRQVYVSGFPVWFAVGRASVGRPVLIEDVPDLPPGEYDVVFGVWNGRAEERISVKGENITRRERRKKYVSAGKIRRES